MTIAAPTLRGWDMFDYLRALEDSDLAPMVRHVLGVMSLAPTQGSEGGASGPNLSTPALARRTGCDRRTVARCLDIAEKDGWIVRIRRGRGRRTDYRLIIPGVIHNLGHHAPTPEPNLVHHAPTTWCTTPQPLGHHAPTDLPLLTKVPSIDQSVRARVRATCPDLTPDDDDLATLIKNLETRPRHPVRNVAAYLQTCPPADIRRLLAEARQPEPPASPTPPRPEEPVPDCVHGNDGGLTRIGTPRCPRCRQIAAQLSASQPFTASLDEGDRTAPPRAAESLSGLVSAAVTA